MKPKNKSKKKTERDNVRAARFQAKKRQEEDAAAPEASKDDPLPTTSSPRAPGPSTFAFAEPTPENLSADSNFANMNIDGNATISTEHASSQTDSADLSESSDALLESCQEELRTIRQENKRLANVITQQQEMMNRCKACRYELEHIEREKFKRELSLGFQKEKEARQSSEQAERTSQPTSNIQQGRKHFK